MVKVRDIIATYITRKLRKFVAVWVVIGGLPIAHESIAHFSDPQLRAFMVIPITMSAPLFGLESDVGLESDAGSSGTNCEKCKCLIHFDFVFVF